MSATAKTKPSAHSPTGLTKLDRASWAARVNQLIEAKAAKKRADAEARAADAIVKAATAELLSAMGNASAALCGKAVLTRKEGAGAEAALTLTDGSRLPWASVTSLLVGNVTVARSAVQTLFGGRAANISVDVAGEP